jgi:ABC-type polysaccharide/polyol phosphate export permease
MLIAGMRFGSYLLLLPISISIFVIFLFTFSLILSTVYIFFRDTQQIVLLLMTVWFWATPIVYMPKIIPKGMKFITEMNPANFLVNIFRDPIYQNKFYHWREAAVFVLGTLLLLFLGSKMFKKLRKHIPDEI